MTGTSYLNNVTLINKLTVCIYCELIIENINYPTTLLRVLLLLFNNANDS